MPISAFTIPTVLGQAREPQPEGLCDRAQALFIAAAAFELRHFSEIRTFTTCSHTVAHD
jgi:hypothetical protein